MVPEKESRADDVLDALVREIASLQSTGDDKYSLGLFPTQRSHRMLGGEVEDDTIFPTAVVVYTVQQVQQALPPTGRRIVDEIVRRAVANYPKYLNNEGQKIYNFWVNVPQARFFPGSKLMGRFRIFHLPEDIDTTAYAYLTLPHDEGEIRRLKERLAVDTNLNRREIRNTLPHYRDLRAYSTWIADKNMPIDFDVCALSNLMLLVLRHKLSLTVHDQDSLRYIASVVDRAEHRTHPFEVSPWYGNPAVILYHVSRLAAQDDVPIVGDCRDSLLRHLSAEIARTPSFMERVMLSTSMMRLGEPTALSDFTEVPGSVDDFFFFIGSIFTPIDSAVTWALARSPWFQVRYRCRAHALALLLEHEVLRRSRSGRWE
jgi:hypothetical protein